MPRHKGLADKAISGAKWTYIGTAGRIIAQFLGQIILSRMLGPESVGLFAYAFMIVSLVTLILEMGLGSALVQRHDLDQRAIGAASSRLLVAGVIGFVAQWVLADSIAVYIFNQPTAALVIQVMAGSYIASAISVPVMAQLRRNMSFRDLQKSQMYSYFIAYLFVGIISAAFGAGVWALVLAWYTNLILQFLFMVKLSPQAITFSTPFHKTGVEAYGLYITLTNVVNWFIDSLASFIVGRYWGATPLGLYNTGNNLVRTPANHLVTTLQQVLFATVSRLQHDNHVTALAYKIAVSIVLTVALPVFGYLALASDVVVSFLLGSKWDEAALLLPALSLAMIPHTLMAVGGPVLNGKGRPERELIAQGISLLLIAAILIGLAGHSIQALVWGVFIGFCIRSLVMTYTVMMNLGLGKDDVIDLFLPPTVIGVVFIGSSEFALWVLNFVHMIPVLVIFGTLAFAIGITSLTTILFPRVCISKEVAWLLRRVFGKHEYYIIDKVTSHASLGA